MSLTQNVFKYNFTNFNPRTDGVRAHWSGPTWHRPRAEACQLKYEKRRKLVTSGQRYWIQVDNIYHFNLPKSFSVQVKNNATGARVINTTI